MNHRKFCLFKDFPFLFLSNYLYCLYARLSADEIAYTCIFIYNSCITKLTELQENQQDNLLVYAKINLHLTLFELFMLQYTHIQTNTYIRSYVYIVCCINLIDFIARMLAIKYEVMDARKPLFAYYTHDIKTKCA